MARNVALLAFGVVVGIVAGAALGIHASSEDIADASGPGPEAAVPPDDVAVASPVAAAPSIWQRLAQCESTGRWAIVNPPYYGGLQQDLVFWRRYGGLAFAARPDLASPSQQILVAQRGQAVQGWAAWPACSRLLGLR
jgi:hypothetical protein